MAQLHEDDLFRHSSMTFGEHLEELRRHLFRAFMWLGIGLLVGLAAGQWVVKVIESPLENALKDYYEQKAIKKYQEAEEGPFPLEEHDLVTRGFISEQLFVEPGKVAADFERFFPGTVPPNALAAHHLSAKDLTDPKDLAKKLVDAGAASPESAATPARHIWALLTPAERETVTAVATADSPSAAEIDRFGAALDRILAREDFYEEHSFAEVVGSAAPSEQIKHRAERGTDALQRINWFLLHTAFVNSIAAPHTELLPLTIWHKTEDDPRVHLTSMGASEPFVIYVKASLLAAFILASPWIFREIWLFVASGLYPHERRYVYIFLPFSVGLFLTGALMAFFIAFPPVLRFLLSFNDILGINPDPRISEWLTFVLFLPLAFGIGFQLPLVMLFVNRIGLVSVKTYLVQWRIAVLVIFVTATLLCPSPDIYSMLLMAGPMTVLYFLGIALCHYTTPRRPAALGGE